VFKTEFDWPKLQKQNGTLEQKRSISTSLIRQPRSYSRWNV